MLPMPVQTTTEAVAFILKSIINKIDASDITLLFLYKNNFIRTVSLIFALIQEQLKTISLRFEKKKRKVE